MCNVSLTDSCLSRCLVLCYSGSPVQDDVPIIPHYMRNLPVYKIVGRNVLSSPVEERNEAVYSAWKVSTLVSRTDR